MRSKANSDSSFAAICAVKGISIAAKPKEPAWNRNVQAARQCKQKAEIDKQREFDFTLLLGCYFSRIYSHGTYLISNILTFQDHANCARGYMQRASASASTATVSFLFSPFCTRTHTLQYMQLLLLGKCADLVGGPAPRFGFWPQHHSAQHLEAIKSWVCLMCKLCATGCEGEGTASAPFIFVLDVWLILAY